MALKDHFAFYIQQIKKIHNKCFCHFFEEVPLAFFPESRLSRKTVNLTTFIRLKNAHVFQNSLLLVVFGVC